MRRYALYRVPVLVNHVFIFVSWGFPRTFFHHYFSKCVFYFKSPTHFPFSESCSPPPWQPSTNWISWNFRGVSGLNAVREAFNICKILTLHKVKRTPCTLFICYHKGVLNTSKRNFSRNPHCLCRCWPPSHGFLSVQSAFRQLGQDQFRYGGKREEIEGRGSIWDSSSLANAPSYFAGLAAL